MHDVVALPSVDRICVYPWVLWCMSGHIRPSTRPQTHNPPQYPPSEVPQVLQRSGSSAPAPKEEVSREHSSR